MVVIGHLWLQGEPGCEQGSAGQQQGEHRPSAPTRHTRLPPLLETTVCAAGWGSQSTQCLWLTGATVASSADMSPFTTCPTGFSVLSPLKPWPQFSSSKYLRVSNGRLQLRKRDIKSNLGREVLLQRRGTNTQGGNLARSAAAGRTEGTAGGPVSWQFLMTIYPGNL